MGAADWLRPAVFRLRLFPSCTLSLPNTFTLTDKPLREAKLRSVSSKQKQNNPTDSQAVVENLSVQKTGPQSDIQLSIIKRMCVKKQRGRGRRTRCSEHVN